MNILGSMYKFAKEILTRSLVLAFMIMLIIAAIALITKLEHIANRLAEIAYFNLVLAVIIQLVILIKEGEKN